ncbi:MAG: HAD-IC family P-type ATPase, partial [Bacteroidota bacterium]
MSSFNGLSESHAKELLLTHGYNELPETESRHITEIILEVLREPMFILLLSCGIVYLLLGDYAEGILLLCWILVIIYITIYQHRKTEKSLGKLRQIASPMSTVMRDGKACRIAGRELVPGDIILVHEGERIPADAHLLEVHQLMVDESMLTGESIPVLKEMTPNSCDESSLFGGTLVVSGKGMARVNLTGIHTKMGKIGQALKTIEEGETRLQKETRWLIKRLFLGGI